jgi:hypothetical protein
MGVKYKNYRKHPEVVEFQPLVNDDYFEIKTFKTAVWQYLLDHARHVPGNNLKIYIPITNDEDVFWKRVKARKNGWFKRVDNYDFRRDIHEREELFNKLVKDKKNKDDYAKFLSQIAREGSTKQKVIFHIARFIIKTGRKLMNALSPPQG